MRSFAILPLVVVMTGFACGRPSSREIEAGSVELATRLLQDSVEHSLASMPDVVFYLDASKSMAGYAGCTHRTSHFDYVLNRLSTALHQPRVQLFGVSGRDTSYLSQSDLSHEVNCPETYSRTENRDSLLFSRIVRSREPAVYFTDGVQSDATSSSLARVAALLGEWIESGHSLAWVVDTSTFVGDVWSERGRRSGGIDTIPGKPFHVLVFANDPAQLDSLLAAAGPVLVDARIYRFDSHAVRCQLTKFHSGELPRMDMENHWFSPSASDLRALADTGVLAEIECDDQYPVARLTPSANPRISGVWTKQGFDTVQPPPYTIYTGAKTAAITSAGNVRRARHTVNAFIPRPPSGTVSFWDIRFALSAAGGLAPEIHDLSTDDDSDVHARTKTYRFTWLMEQLVEATERVRTKSVPVFLTIRNL
jgi:hypothetical protein